MKKKRCFIAVFIVLAVCLVSTGAMAYQVETEKPSRFAISKLEVESAKIAAEDSTVGVLQAVGDAITDWADWLMVGTKPGTVYDGTWDFSVQFTLFPGEDINGVLGYVAATNRYYLAAEGEIEGLDILQQKIDNLGLFLGLSAPPDIFQDFRTERLKVIGGLSWNLRA